MKRISFFLPITTKTPLPSITGGIFGHILLMVLGLCSPASHAQSYTQQTVYSFGPYNQGDGRNPVANLISLNGKLYGISGGGDSMGHGTVFSVDLTTHAEQILYSFNGGTADGEEPSNLTAMGGILYGTTYQGGPSNNGTLFSIDPNTHAEQVLYSFKGGLSDGQIPEADLINIGGKFYGITYGGGSNSYGTIYSFDPNTHIEQVLYSFKGNTTDGFNPQSRLIEINGILYGVTENGGPSVTGTIFSFDINTNTEQVLYTFKGGSSDGSDPFDLINIGGILYGVTDQGGSSGYGTIFSFDPNTHVEQMLYSFKGSTTDGISPNAGLIDVNGTLYGTTLEGGTDQGGTAFSFSPNTLVEQTLYNFPSKYGRAATPIGGLTNINGTLFGSTFYSGTNGTGTVFSLTPVPPIAHNDNGRTPYNTALVITSPGVLGNDNNQGNGTITASLVANPTHGTITLNSDGSFKYTPNIGYLGTDSFTYQAVGIGGQSNIATCTLTIQARTPIAANDSGRTFYNTPLVINAPGVLTNDANGDTTTMTASLVTNPSHGTINFNSDGSFKYTPTAGYLGTDSFTYQATNDIGASNTATCAILVQARTPIAYNDAGKVTHNTTATFAAPAVLGNDYLGTNGTVTAALVTNPSHGTITFNGDGSFKYTPTIGFLGTDSFTYKDTNSVGTSNTATCTLTVQ